MREAISSIIGRIGPAASLRTINDQLRGELPRIFFSASSEAVSVDNDAALVMDSSPCHGATMIISPRHPVSSGLFADADTYRKCILGVEVVHQKSFGGATKSDPY